MCAGSRKYKPNFNLQSGFKLEAAKIQIAVISIGLSAESPSDLTVRSTLCRHGTKKSGNISGNFRTWSIGVLRHIVKLLQE